MQFKSKKIEKLRNIIAAVVFFFIGGVATLYIVKFEVDSVPEPVFHEHADFALFLDTVRFDFAKDEFMSIKPCVARASSWVPTAYAHGLDLEEAVDLHNRDGNVVHVHQQGITWHEFFESLKMGLEDNLFVDHEGNQYKEDETFEFYFFVNGERVDTLADREIRDLDQVSISYHSSENPPAFAGFEHGMVTNNACLFSSSCPQRGLAPLESCGDVEEKPTPLLEWLGL